jgi:hypothetical protein
MEILTHTGGETLSSFGRPMPEQMHASTCFSKEVQSPDPGRLNERRQLCVTHAPHVTVPLARSSCKR